MSAHREMVEYIAGLYAKAVKREHELKAQLDEQQRVVAELSRMLVSVSRDTAPIPDLPSNQ